MNCQNGGSWSPHVRPWSNVQSYPQWLNPIRLSFWPAMRFSEFVGLETMVSSACRLREQSWLTRVLVIAPATRIRWQPCVLVAGGRAGAFPVALTRRSRTPVACSRAYMAPEDSCILTWLFVALPSSTFNAWRRSRFLMCGTRLPLRALAENSSPAIIGDLIPSA